METIKKVWETITAGVATFWDSMTPDARSFLLGLACGFATGAAFAVLVFCI